MQDELASCKSRLNSALDAQDDVLRKNSEKHSQIYELQNKETGLREELSSKAGLVDYYQEQNTALETELQEVIQRAQTTEKRLNDELGETLDALGQCRNELLARASENESLAAKAGALAAEVEQKEAELDAKDAELAAAAAERTEVRDELQSSIVRLESVQAAQNELRRQIGEKHAEVEAKHVEIKELHIHHEERHRVKDVRIQDHENRHEAKEGEIASLKSKITMLETKSAEIPVLHKTQEHLAEQLGERDKELAQLRSENARLAVQCEDAAYLRRSRQELAAQLADHEAEAARFQAEASRLTFEKENLRQAGEASERRMEVELSASKAKERALMDQTVSLHRYIGGRDARAQSADVAASRALRSYHALRTDRIAAVRAEEYLNRRRMGF